MQTGPLEAATEIRARNFFTRESFLAIGFDGRVLEIDAPGDEFALHAADELLGRGVDALLDARELTCLIEHVSALRRAPGERGAPRELELVAQVRRRDGALVPYACRVVADHARERFCVAARPRVDARAVAVSSLRAWGELFDRTAVSVMVHDTAGRLFEVNRALCRELGYTREQLLTMGVADIDIMIRPNQIAGSGVWKRLRQGHPVTVESVQRRRDGSTFPVEVRLAACEHEGEMMIVAASLDISVRKHAEAHLQRLNAQLREAHDAALSASRAKSTFLANMSHELRTPLNAIMGYAELLKEDLADLGMVTEVRDLERIYAAASHQLSLINDILDLSRIEAGKTNVHVEACSLRRIVQQSVATVQPLLKGSALALELEDGLDVLRTDGVRLRQVLINLLSNACKFTERGVITLAVRREQRRGAPWVALEVRDTGIGIPPETLSRLFTAFEQADDSIQQRYGGTGLGLAISRKICRMLDGDIDVVSVVGEGSTFTVRLPMRDAEESRADRQTELPLPRESSGALDPHADIALVIDDDPAVHALVREPLARRGLQTVSAMDGYEGLSLARALRPTIILLDLFMPGIDGWEVLNKLRADPTVANIPTVLVSIAAEEARGFALGATEYLSKPIRIDQLVDVVERHRGGGMGSVLVVDDDPSCREIITRTASAEGWRVRTAADGAAAIAAIEQERPAVVLLDLMMPEVDGFAVVEHVRATPTLRELPIVVISALDLDRDARAKLEGRVQAIIHKERLSVDELVARLTHLPRP
ncbi:MAG: response regulator, partial [Myxococcales bacterium]|nr:response regulator [Myxococcales bacterium]